MIKAGDMIMPNENDATARIPIPYTVRIHRELICLTRIEAQDIVASLVAQLFERMTEE